MPLLAAWPAWAGAGDEVTFADLQASVRAIGFLNNIPHDGTLVIGIVYAGGADAKTKAQQAASQLGNITATDKAKLSPILIASKELAQFNGRLDALILMPNQAAAGEIIDTIRRRRLVSISTDPGCLNTKCCVLMIQTGANVHVVVDTAVAAQVGAQFSPIFLMMAERR